jgi:hypothetical protein
LLCDLERASPAVSIGKREEEVKVHQRPKMEERGERREERGERREERGERTKDQGLGTKDQRPRTNDQGPQLVNRRPEVRVEPPRTPRLETVGGTSLSRFGQAE